MSKKLGSKPSALKRLSQNMNSILANAETKRRKISPDVKQKSCKKLKLKSDPTTLFKRFKFDINEKENHVLPLDSITTVKSNDYKPRKALKVWTPPLKINKNSGKIFDKLQNTERSIGVSSTTKSEMYKHKIPSETVTRSLKETIDVSDENLDDTSEPFYKTEEVNKINKKEDLQDSSQLNKSNALTGSDSVTNEACFDMKYDVVELNPMADTFIREQDDTAGNFNVPEDNYENKDQHVTESNYYDSTNKLDFEINDTPNKNCNEIRIKQVSPNENTKIIMKSNGDNEDVFSTKELLLNSENIIDQDIAEVYKMKKQDSGNIKESVTDLKEINLEQEEINKSKEKFYDAYSNMISQNFQSNSELTSISGITTNKEINFITDNDTYYAEINNEFQRNECLDDNRKIQKSDKDDFFFTCVNDGISLNATLEIDHEKNNIHSQNEKICNSNKLIVNEFNVCDNAEKASNITTKINSVIDDTVKNYEIKEVQKSSVTTHDSESTIFDATSISSMLFHEDSNGKSSYYAKVIRNNHDEELDNNGNHNRVTNICSISEDDINKSQVIEDEDQIIETKEEEEAIQSDTNNTRNNNDDLNNEIQLEESQIILSGLDNDKDSLANLQISDNSREVNINDLINNKVEEFILNENIEECGIEIYNNIPLVNSDKGGTIQEKDEEVSFYNKSETMHLVINDNTDNHCLHNNNYDDSRPEECQIISLDSDVSKSSQESCIEIIKDDGNEQKIDELVKTEEIKKEKYDDLIECTDDFYNIQMSEVIRIENEYTETKRSFSKQNNENIYETFNRSNISSTSNANTGNTSKNLMAANRYMNSVHNNKPQVNPPKLEWVQKMNEEKQKLRSVIQEINKLNNMVLQARKQLCPHQFSNQ